MGGRLILATALLPTLAWGNLTNAYVWVAMVSTLTFGMVGLLDDYLNVVRKRPRRLRPWYKLIAQGLVTVGVGFTFVWLSGYNLYNTELIVPLLQRLTPDLGWFYVPSILLVLAFLSNAVNLADDLDGLAISLFTVAAAALTVLAYLTGHPIFAEYVLLTHFSPAAELTVYCVALVVSGLGFLWYNSHPAKLFMGEVGALALGGALGTVAILLKPALLLPIVGAVFVIELFSIVIVDDTLRALTRYLRQRSDIHKESGRKPPPTEASDSAAHIHRIETDGSLDSAIGLSVSPLTRRDGLVPLSTASQRGDRRQRRRVQIIRTTARESQATTTAQSAFFPSLGEIVDATAERVRTVEAQIHQQQIHRLTRGVVLIDDSSTANPATVGTALSTLSTDTQSGRRVAVLGEMLELGEQTLELHRGTGRAAAVAGLGMLVTVGGASARALGLTAVEAGLPSPGVIHCETSEEAAARVSTLLQDDDLVLVKGSRQVRTELVVLRLIKEWA